MSGARQACWLHAGANTRLQGTVDAQHIGIFGSMGWLSAGAMVAPFMPIQCYGGWLQDYSFGCPCAGGANRYSNHTPAGAIAI